MELDNDIIRELSKQMVEQVTKDIVSVQPMPSNIMKDLMEVTKNAEQELIDLGYEPVCPHGIRLIWVKKK